MNALKHLRLFVRGRQGQFVDGLLDLGATIDAPGRIWRLRRDGDARLRGERRGPGARVNRGQRLNDVTLWGKVRRQQLRERAPRWLEPRRHRAGDRLHRASPRRHEGGLVEDLADWQLRLGGEDASALQWRAGLLAAFALLRAAGGRARKAATLRDPVGDAHGHAVLVRMPTVAEHALAAQKLQPVHVLLANVQVVFQPLPARTRRIREKCRRVCPRRWPRVAVQATLADVNRSDGDGEAHAVHVHDGRRRPIEIAALARCDCQTPQPGSGPPAGIFVARPSRQQGQAEVRPSRPNARPSAEESTPDLLGRPPSRA